MQRTTAGAPYWIRLFLAVFAGAFAVIGGAQFLKGHTLHYAVGQGLLWGAISAAIFVSAHFYRLRKGRQCAICVEAPRSLCGTQEDRTVSVNAESVNPESASRR